MKDSFHFNRQLKVQECVSWHRQQLCGSWTDRAAYHSAKSSGQLRVLLTMRAPWDGGLDQVVLTIFSIWDRMRVRFSLSWATTVRLPTLSSDNSGREKRDCFIKSHLQCSVVKPPRKIHVSASCLLTVEAKVFGEGLSHEQLKALGDKVADGPGVFIQTAGGETLIGRVKEHEQVPPLETQRQRDDEKTPREHNLS